MAHNDKTSLSLYIHIPFCRVRCGYCDFNTYAGMGDYIPKYFRALEWELSHFSSHLRNSHYLSTIYFGGGTPSMIPATLIGNLLKEVNQQFDLNEKVEISLEANPNTLSEEYLEEIASYGVNRISIGMQSAIQQELSILDRQHTLKGVQNAVHKARRAGFENINIDLMFGVPLQDLASLKTSIDQAITLNPQHLSVYGLDLHAGTPLHEKILSGKEEPPDEDLVGDMYAWLMDYLPGKGFFQYEISNWTTDLAFECKHNLQYWRNLDYLGIGAGAHSYIGENRWWNENLIPTYINAICEAKDSGFFHPAIAGNTDLSPDDVLKETVMMGLRLTREGVILNSFENRFSVNLISRFRSEIDKMGKLGLVEIASDVNGDCLRLTRNGCMLGNQVFQEFI